MKFKVIRKKNFVHESKNKPDGKKLIIQVAAE
jgi:hypothetical protein